MGKTRTTFPTGATGLTIEQLSKFASKFAINGQTNCWEWQGKLTPDGYATYYIRPRVARAHRAMHELTTGKVLNPKLVIDHLCRVRRCVNPNHLEAVTNKENVLRGEGSTAKNARKTHCKYGHDMSPANVYITNQGGRFCKRCSYLNTKNRRIRIRLTKLEEPQNHPISVLQQYKANLSGKRE